MLQTLYRYLKCKQCFVHLHVPTKNALRSSTTWSIQTHTPTQKVVADTGAQLCVCGPEVIEQHPHLKRWLLPTKKS